jgi:hypothetical protein
MSAARASSAPSDDMFQTSIEDTVELLIGAQIDSAPATISHNSFGR